MYQNLLTRNTFYGLQQNFSPSRGGLSLITVNDNRFNNISYDAMKELTTYFAEDVDRNLTFDGGDYEIQKEDDGQCITDMVSKSVNTVAISNTDLATHYILRGYTKRERYPIRLPKAIIFDSDTMKTFNLVSQNLIDSSQSILIGIDPLYCTDHELKYLRRLNFTILDAKMVNNMNPQDILTVVGRSIFSGPVYISIDLSSVNRRDVPATDRIATGCMSTNKLRTIIEKLHPKFEVDGADITSYNPSMDYLECTAKNILPIFTNLVDKSYNHTKNRVNEHHDLKEILEMI